MPVLLKSSEVQQNFGRVMDQALTEGDVIVERYGEPRIVILGYRRYQELLQLEERRDEMYLAQPDSSLEAREQGQMLADEVRDELRDALDASLDEVMASLRGRSWLP